MPKLGHVELDSRGRLSLGKFLPEKSAGMFVVESLGGGVIILRPADVVTRDDQALASRPDIIERARKASLADVDDLPRFPGRE